ncbi:MAG: hypothetical protein AAGA77_06465 [Bacteroidota bacterium]
MRLFYSIYTFIYYQACSSMNITTNSFLLLFCSLGIQLNAQIQKDYSTLAQNKVEIRYGFGIDVNNPKDTFLITEELYNTQGREVLHRNYSEDSVRSEYHYVYLHDTLRTERITKLNGVFHSKSILTYDNQNRLIKTEDFDLNGNPTGTYETFKYKKGGKKVEYRLYFENQLSRQTQTHYDDHGKIVQYREKFRGKWQDIPLIEPGSKYLRIKEIKNYGHLNLTLKLTTEIIQKNRRQIGASQMLQLKKGDELFTESFSYPNGLRHSTRQYVNDVLVGLKHYKYKFRK